jgi:hypothetical protein
MNEYWLSTFKILRNEEVGVLNYDTVVACGDIGCFASSALKCSGSSLSIPH